MDEPLPLTLWEFAKLRFPLRCHWYGRTFDIDVSTLREPHWRRVRRHPARYPVENPRAFPREIALAEREAERLRQRARSLILWLSLAVHGLLREGDAKVSGVRDGRRVPLDRHDLAGLSVDLTTSSLRGGAEYQEVTVLVEQTGRVRQLDAPAPVADALPEASGRTAGMEPVSVRGYALKDDPLIEEMRGMILSERIVPFAAAKRVAPKAEGASWGAKVDRLQRRYKGKYGITVPPKTPENSRKLPKD